MKQFEKWFDTDKLIDRLDTNYTNNVCSGLTWDTIVEVSEYTWKAALKWAIAKLEPNLEDWEQDFLDEIREELQGE